MSEKENLLPRTSKKSDSEGVSRAGEWRSLQPGPTRYGSIPSQRRRLLPKFDFQRRHAWIVCIVLALGVVGIGLGLGLGLPRSSAMSSPGNVTTAASTSTSSNPPKTTRSVSSTPTSTTSPSTVTTSRTSTVSSTSSPTTTTTTTTVRTNATTTTTTSPPAVNGTAPAAAPVLNAANPRSAGAGRNSRRVDVAAPEHEPGTQKQPPRARRPQRSASAAVDASGTVRNERPLYRLPPPRRLNSFVPASDYAPLGAAAAADVASHGVSGRFKRAAVASDGKPCAQIAKRMLERGGSAVDGAVAALLCVGVVSPQSTGIGGGMVMTVYDETTGSADTLLARETAPAAARPDMFANDSDASLIGQKREKIGYEL